MHLVLATEAQKAERDRVTHSAWGSPLTVEQFHQREVRLRAHPWCREGMRTWLLLDDDGRVLASCESFHNDSFLLGPDGEYAAGDSFSIASVFTEESLRGRGHASRMMDLVAAELERASPRGHAAVLFSDVGAPLYRRSGYEETPAWDWNLQPRADQSTRHVDALLKDADVPAALQRMRRPSVPFFLWPSPAQMDWHLERERIYAEMLRRPRPEACGATVGDSTALWAMMARSGELVVLMLDVRCEADATALLDAACAMARKAGLSKVVLWEEPGTMPWVARVPGAARVAREGSLPMVRPLRPGLPAAPDVPFPRALWV
ncbi:GNAT family N-acetyltransferase [Pyxidicoccus fallax]|uniref:GNAT family N-acetyltransferase n=1 Tax=Pyxidicoccus fallax TaxID=394095 RepID=A0A848M1D2_9BACT|nr:GNAT family N-acetyltransferase [Pyxidicoccus fallax]NMO23174.1 GNAT family N-acetyltransferase [Pyxidicoccus fallax]NPC86536.1 GNAT family N-acetyltransferase [Pyxidicoccus fallax]